MPSRARRSGRSVRLFQDLGRVGEGAEIAALGGADAVKEAGAVASADRGLRIALPYAPGKTVAELGKEVARHIAEGFIVAKLKVAGLTTEEDLARIAAAVHDIGWCEVPIPLTNYEGYRWLAARGLIPLCGNETLSWRERFAALIDAGLDFIMPDMSACGEIPEALAIAGATAHGGTPLHFVLLSQRSPVHAQPARGNGGRGLSLTPGMLARHAAW